MERVPLDALIGESLSLQTRSGRKVGLCPFHPEKSPSFTIYDSHYFCFGCRAHGDAIDFARHQQGLGFIDALKFLAKKFAIEAPEFEDSERQNRQRQAMSNLYRALDAAQDHFVAQLYQPGNDKYRRYLIERGFTELSIKEFGFGFAPGDTNTLLTSLRRQSFRLEDLDSVSLLTRSQEGQRYYDFFRDRLTIPIRDGQGRLIAFGGRTTVNHPAKYLNSRDNPLFDKSTVLFGFDRAKAAIRQAGYAIIVEGYMDTLMLWQCGVPNAVACLGTALTPAHLRQLKQVTSRVVLLFDGDTAGQKASLRSVDTALTQPQMQVQVAVLPDQEDPDVYIRRVGAEGLLALINKAPDLLDYALRQKLAGIKGLAIAELVNTEFVPWLRQIRDPIQRSFLISRLAQFSGVQIKDIESAIATARPNQVAPKSTSQLDEVATKTTVGKPASELTQIEYELLAHLFFSKPGELDNQLIQTMIHQELEFDERWSRVAEYFMNILTHGSSPASLELTALQQNADPEVEKFLERARAAAIAFDCSNRRERLAKLALRQKETRLKLALSDLKVRLRKASAMPQTDGSEVPELLKAIKSINNDIISLEKN